LIVLYLQGWLCRTWTCSRSSSMFSLQPTWTHTSKLSVSVDTSIYGDRCQTQGGLHRSTRCAQGRTRG
jgi:hypothetical protein